LTNSAKFDGGLDFEEALLALNRLGYAVDAVILDAVRWVPQSRARLFVIGKRKHAKDCRSFAMKSGARPKALAGFILEHRNIVWDIADLPTLPDHGARLADIIEDLPDNDPHWWNKKRAERFMSQMSKRHMADAQRMIDGNQITYATAFRRVRNSKSMAELRTDGIAGCLRTPRGGSGRQILFKAGNGNYQHACLRDVSVRAYKACLTLM
jgi:DNA (cytosine-5)-methyltransferase 1